MNTEPILPLSVALGVLIFSLIGKWYVMPWVASMPRSAALIPFLLLHSSRYLGLAFLIPGVTSEVLDPRFATPAAYGDLLAGILALIAIMALRLRWTIAIPLVWVFNLVGVLDLLNALFQGVRYIPSGHFGATYFIPAIIVPALLVTHFMIFVLLLRGTSEVKEEN